MNTLEVPEMKRISKSLAFAVYMVFTLTGSAQNKAATAGSDARPPVTSLDLKIAQRARQILSSQSKWNRNDNRVCLKDAKTFSLYCALETATEEVSGNFEHRGAAMQEARFVIEDVSPKGKDYDHRLMGFNNDPSTSFQDIQNVLRLLEERIAKHLKAIPRDSNDLLHRLP